MTDELGGDQLSLLDDEPEALAPVPPPQRSLLADTGRLDPRRRHKKPDSKKREKQTNPAQRRKHGQL